MRKTHFFCTLVLLPSLIVNRAIRHQKGPFHYSITYACPIRPIFSFSGMSWPYKYNENYRREVEYKRASPAACAKLHRDPKENLWQRVPWPWCFCHQPSSRLQWFHPFGSAVLTSHVDLPRAQIQILFWSILSRFHRWILCLGHKTEPAHKTTNGHEVFTATAHTHF